MALYVLNVPYKSSASYQPPTTITACLPGLVVDLRGEKSLRILGLPATGFARVFNLTDTRYSNGFIFNTSGSPYYSRFPNKDYAKLADPTRYYAPRRLEVGLSLRSSE